MVSLARRPDLRWLILFNVIGMMTCFAAYFGAVPQTIVIPLLALGVVSLRKEWVATAWIPVGLWLVYHRFAPIAVVTDAILILGVARSWGRFGQVALFAVFAIAIANPIALILSAAVLLLMRVRMARDLTSWDGILAVGGGAAAAVFAPTEDLRLGLAVCCLMSIAATVRFLVAEMESASNQEIVRLYLGMLDRTHPYTTGHASRVGRLAASVGFQLGMRNSETKALELAAILHDVGKVTIDEEILDLPRRLSESEMNHVKLHAAAGGDVLEPIKGFEGIAGWIRCHHERTDGQGYPSGLVGREVPIESRIIAVIDAFDAMTGGDAEHERRTYRDPMAADESVKELQRCSGRQFDARVVGAFEKVLRKENVQC